MRIAPLEGVLSEIIRQPSDTFTVPRTIFVAVVFTALFLFSRYLKTQERKPGVNEQRAALGEEIPLSEAYRRADRVVTRLLRSLPTDLKCKTTDLNWILQDWPDTNKDIWGLYKQRPSALIFIYVAPIFLYCRDNDFSFEQEIKNTFLHELGHHLGLSESDLEARGLR